jgi:hypothetical protein
MGKFTNNLWEDLVREHGTTLAQADRPGAGRARRPRRRALAVGSLGLAGAGAALTLALSALGSTPAYAITTNGDGSVLVTINQVSALPQANAKLAAMGTGEQISVQMAPGAAAVSGPVNCVPSGDVAGPSVQVIVSTEGTETIPSGNSGAGTWHLASCQVSAAGNAGAGNTGPTGTSGAG